jgi:rRNA-processing protein FCF1/serine/threonine protein kinase
MSATKTETLRQILSTHKVLLDTCFALRHGFEHFVQEYADVFRNHPILVPKRVLDELRVLAKKRPSISERAEQTLAFLRHCRQRGLVDVRYESCDEDRPADQVISRVVEQHVGRRNLLVLTNDKKLAEWILHKKKSECYRLNTSLLVVCMHGSRRQVRILENEADLGNGKGAIPVHRHSAAPRGGLRAFREVTDLAPNLETPISCSQPIGKGSSVVARDQTRVQLGEEIARGGEGIVFRTDQRGIVCKIYHPEKLTIGKKEKIELMTTRALPDPTICWPIQPVYDTTGVFRGFSMPEAKGEPLARSLFYPTQWLVKHPNWTRRESVRLALTILQKINLLHSLNVLLGDINPMNILVVDENTVYFVDCDSYQVEGYPCPVGFVNFVAPEIQGFDFRTFLRTKEHELFAIATLLFMIMVPGKSPYSHQGGGDGAENIRKGHFPYPLGDKHAEGVAVGPWRFCWSHLSRRLKEAFYQSFHADHRAERRIPVQRWIRLFEEYERILSDPAKVFMGPQAQLGFDLSILPQNFRYLRTESGNIVPRPLPPDGETDLQRYTLKMARDLANSALTPVPTVPVASSHQVFVFAGGLATSGSAGAAVPKVTRSSCKKTRRQPQAVVPQQVRSTWPAGGSRSQNVRGSSIAVWGAAVGATIGGMIGFVVGVTGGLGAALLWTALGAAGGWLIGRQWD